jgi:peptidyl-tRNA hydrolase, PTH1 family
MSGERWIVCGLGNPGSQYSSTRHNIGQLVIDYLAGTSKFAAHKSKTNIAEIKVAGVPVTLAKSQGFMNESGAPLRALADFYKVLPDHLIVIHDELDIPFKEIRLKLGGGDNGHNGLKSLSANFSPDYFRVRMGVGRPAGPQDPADFVLQKFSPSEQTDLSDFVSRGALATEKLIEKGLDLAQNEFNK